MRTPSNARDFRHSLDLSRMPLRIKNSVALHIEANGERVRFSQEGIPWRVLSALVSAGSISIASERAPDTMLTLLGNSIMSVLFSYKFELFPERHRVEVRRDADVASAGTCILGILCSAAHCDKMEMVDARFGKSSPFLSRSQNSK
jgi:hypothetical protein